MLVKSKICRHEKHTIIPDIYYMRMKLRIPGENPAMDEKTFKLILFSLMKRVFGSITSTIHGELDLIHFNTTNLSGVVRVSSKNLVQAWAAMTFCSSYEGRSCKIEIEQVASSLMELASYRFLQNISVD